MSVIIAIRIMPYTIPTNSQLKICEGMLVNCFNFLPHCHGEIDQIFKMLPTSSVVLHDIIAKVLSALYSGVAFQLLYLSKVSLAGQTLSCKCFQLSLSSPEKRTAPLSGVDQNLQTRISKYDIETSCLPPKISFKRRRHSRP